MNKLELLKAKLAEITNKLKEFESVEDYSDAQVEEMNALTDEYDMTNKTIVALEKAEQIKAASNVSKRVVTPKDTIVVDPNNREKSHSFKNFGDFLGAVKVAHTGGQVDKRFNAAAQTSSGEDGGFLIPEEMMSEIATKMQADESLLPKTSQFKVSGNSLSLPTNETSPWTGGIQAYWLAEGAQHTESKEKFGVAGWKLNKLGALVKITDELLEDSVALESYIRAKAPVAIMHKINEAILTGNGVGKPQGILNSGFTITVNKESGQAADTIVAKNVIKMYSRMIPSARANAVWYINAGCEEQLRTMKDDVGNFIYLAPGSQLNQSPYGLLLGRPVVPMLGSMPALGDVGDILFADLSYYYTILKAGGMKQAVSSHLYFDRDIQAYKFVMRIDGSCPFKTPVSAQNGSYTASAFVTLEAR